MKMINQLYKAGLIEKKRQGQGKPTLYYVMDFTAALAQPAVFQKSNNLTSRSQISGTQEVKEFAPSNNDLNKQDRSKNNPSSINDISAGISSTIVSCPDFL